jgi:8-oxo-dGTP diphosphatase
MTAAASSDDGAIRRPKVGVGVMMLRGDEVLIGKRRGSHGESTYGWCGGHVEFGEALEQAAAREVKEETGMEVNRLEFLCVSNIVEYGKHYLDIEFVCTDFQGEPTVREEHRVEDWFWCDLDALPEPLFAAVRLAVNSYRNKTVYNA